MENITLKVYGMTCTLCSISIEAGLERLQGVSKVNVSYAAEKARVQYDSSLIEPLKIEKLIESLGFSVEETRI